MSQKRHTIHGRDHLPGGADPIPGLCTCGAVPLENVLTAEGGSGTWHWWRFRQLEQPAAPTNYTILTPDVVTNDPDNDMQLRWYVMNSPLAQEITGDDPAAPTGPNSDSFAIHRTDAGSFPGPPIIDLNPTNYWSGAAPAADLSFGLGGAFTMLGWFALAGAGQIGWGDVFNIAPASHPPTWLAVNEDRSVVLSRQGTAFTTAEDVAPALQWVFLAVTLGDDQIKVYVNPSADPEPVIDETDPASDSASGLFSIGGPNLPLTPRHADGAFEGDSAEIVLYDHAVDAETLRAIYLAGLYGDTGTIPPQAEIAPGSITPAQLAPGGEGQVLMTVGGVVVWADLP